MMIEKPNKPSLQDFHLVHRYVHQYSDDYDLASDSLGFMLFALDIILGLQDDELDEALTDTTYLQKTGKDSGHDRGIDAIYIDMFEKPAIVHIFNFKYTEKIENTNNFFPSNEIDKVGVTYFL